MRLALCQCMPTVSGNTLATGVRRLSGFAKHAAGENANLLVLPEMFLSGYAIGGAFCQKLAEPLDGPAITQAAEIAREMGIALLFGFPEKDGEACYNSGVLFGATCEVLGSYRKTHLNGAGDDEQFSAGDDLSPVIGFGEWKLAMAICYDIEFPEVARALALRGAEVILVPTANMVPYHSVSERLVPARAEENTVFLAYANLVGKEGETVYSGGTCICGPDGSDLERAGDSPTLIFADLNKDALSIARHAASHLKDRRPDLYQSLSSE